MKHSDIISQVRSLVSDENFNKIISISNKRLKANFIEIKFNNEDDLMHFIDNLDPYITDMRSFRNSNAFQFYGIFDLDTHTKYWSNVCDDVMGMNLSHVKTRRQAVTYYSCNFMEVKKYYQNISK